MIITVGALKGGTGKTHTAVALALQLVRQGPTVLVDADPQGSASTWWRIAEADGYAWPEALTLVAWREPMTLPPMAHAVIDTGPGDVARFRAAMDLSDTVVVPVGAKRGDVPQIGTTVAEVEEVAARRPITWGVLLTGVQLGTHEAADAPAEVDSAGFPRFDTVIPHRLATYGRWTGTVPDRFGAYVDVLAELQETSHAAS